MAKKINKIKLLKNLSWDDQSEWAGSWVVSRERTRGKGSAILFERA